jgi:hypothetical protein
MTGGAGLVGQVANLRPVGNPPPPFYKYPPAARMAEVPVSFVRDLLSDGTGLLAR